MRLRPKVIVAGFVATIVLTSVVVCYIYAEARAELIHSAIARVMRASNPADVVGVSQALNQVICQNRFFERCSIEVFQNGTLLASVPTIIVPSEFTFDTEHFKITSFSPSLSVIAKFGPSNRTIFRGTLLATLFAIVIFTTLLYFETRWRNIQTERRMDYFRSQAELGELAEKVAHDVRSPLSALRMTVTISKNLGSDEISLLNKAIERIDRIASDLLEKSRSTNKKITHSNFEGPSSLLNNGNSSTERMTLIAFIALVRQGVEDKRVELLGVEKAIELNFDDQIPVTRDSLSVSIAPNSFAQIFSNILNNAIDAIGDAGRILITANYEQGRVHIAFSDNGRGISPEIVPTLFKKGRTFGKENGNGLGLYFAKSFVNQWGGDIGIDSVVGRGTKVTISLPIQQVQSY